MSDKSFKVKNGLSFQQDFNKVATVASTSVSVVTASITSSDPDLSAGQGLISIEYNIPAQSGTPFIQFGNAALSQTNIDAIQTLFESTYIQVHFPLSTSPEETMKLTPNGQVSYDGGAVKTTVWSDADALAATSGIRIYGTISDNAGNYNAGGDVVVYPKFIFDTNTASLDTYLPDSGKIIFGNKTIDVSSYTYGGTNNDSFVFTSSAKYAGAFTGSNPSGTTISYYSQGTGLSTLGQDGTELKFTPGTDGWELAGAQIYATPAFVELAEVQSSDAVSSISYYRITGQGQCTGWPAGSENGTLINDLPDISASYTQGGPNGEVLQMQFIFPGVSPWTSTHNAIFSDIVQGAVLSMYLCSGGTLIERHLQVSGPAYYNGAPVTFPITGLSSPYAIEFWGTATNGQTANDWQVGQLQFFSYYGEEFRFGKTAQSTNVILSASVDTNLIDADYVVFGEHTAAVSSVTFSGASATLSTQETIPSGSKFGYFADDSSFSLTVRKHDGTTTSLGYSHADDEWVANGNPIGVIDGLQVPAASSTQSTILARSKYADSAYHTQNVIIGNKAVDAETGAAVSTGVTDCVFIGHKAGEYVGLTGGYDINGTIAIGTKAGWKLGQYGLAQFNTYVGYYSAGNNQTSGDRNTALGAQSQQSAYTGSDNTSVGYYALRDISGGSQNVGIGSGAGRQTTGEGNVFVGYRAGYNLPSANYNTVVGTYALYSSSAAGQNVAIGYNASYSVTNGSNNVNVGYNAGYSMTSGASNVSVGSYALEQTTTQANNAALGYGAAKNMRSASNVAIGYEALRGGTTAASNTGANNVAVGYRTGHGTTSGASNTWIGYEAGYQAGGTITGSNNVALGNGANPASVSTSNTVTLGNSSIATLRCQVTSITALSDERDKTNILDLPLGLDFINQLRPVKFDWNMRDGGKVGISDMGFIAQDLASLEDGLGVHDWTQLTYRENPEKLEASYGRLVPVLVKAIQELTEEVAELKKQVK